MFRAPLLTLIITTLLVAQAPAPATQAGPRPASAPATPATPRPDAVLARIGGQNILQADFDEYLGRAVSPHQREHLEPQSSEMDNLRKKFLDMTVLIAKARKDGLDKTPDFQKRLELTKAQLLLQDILKQASADLEEKATPTEGEVRADYEAHKEKYRSPETFSARQILVSVKGAPGASPTALPEEEAKAKALLAAKELASGKSWTEVAKAYSDDPGSKDKGGLYEVIPFGTFVPEFDQAVRKQALGKVGEPVKSQFGFHVIQPEKINPSKVPPFDEVKDRVKSLAMNAKRTEVFQVFLDGLKKELGFEAMPVNAAPSHVAVSKPAN